MKCVSPEPVDAATVNIEGGQVVELSSEGLDQIAHGYGMVLTSTQVDEDAQHFYRKLGYKDCGGLTDLSKEGCIPLGRKWMRVKHFCNLQRKLCKKY